MRKTFDVHVDRINPETGQSLGQGTWHRDLGTLEKAIQLAEDILKPIYGECVPDEWHTSELAYGELMHIFHDLENDLSIAIFENDVDMIKDRIEDRGINSLTY